MATKTDADKKKAREEARKVPPTRFFTSLLKVREEPGEAIVVYVDNDIVSGVTDANIEEGWVTYIEQGQGKRREGDVRIVKWTAADITALPAVKEEDEVRDEPYLQREKEKKDKLLQEAREKEAALKREQEVEETRARLKTPSAPPPRP
jgi:hypothetical protein